MRNAFIEELVALATDNPQIALVVGDLGYSVIEPFADRVPDRFINAGVAEQNMTGLAAGMAATLLRQQASPHSKDLTKDSTLEA